MVWLLQDAILPKQDTDPRHLSTSGKPFDPVFILSRSVSNIICSVIFGSRFDYEDERLLTIIRFINDNFQIMSSPWGEVSTLRSTDVGRGSPRGPTVEKEAAGTGEEKQAYHLNTKETGAEGLSRVPGQPGLGRENPSSQ